MNRCYSAVYVDDDAAQIALFESVLTNCPQIWVKKTFQEPQEASEWVMSNSVDIAFLDIEMQPYDGFWLAEKIAGSAAMIVFVTSHTEHSLKAFEVAAVDYLVKPINSDQIDRLLQNIDLKIRAIGRRVQSELIQEIKASMNGTSVHPQRVFINALHKVHIVNLADVLFIESKGNYASFQLNNSQSLLSSKNLKFYDEYLESHPDFVRLQRSYLVNKSYVTLIEKDGNRAWVKLKNGERIEISVNRKAEIIQLLMQ